MGNFDFHRELLKLTNSEGKCFGLIETSNNYIVACYYDPSRRWGEQWGHGIYFMFSNNEERLDCLDKAVERFKEKIYGEQ